VKNRLFFLITALVTVSVISAILYVGREVILRAVKPQLLDYAMRNIPKKELDQLYREAVNSAGFYWDTVPDPEVARIGKAGMELTSKKARIRINNAGMRSSRPYISKPTNSYRIVCLGDSFVFGVGGNEEDRFCDQLKDFYRKHGIRVQGKDIEAYALGLGSWTTVQEARYLSSRISSYDPDLIIMLTVANDITDLSGVTGGGAETVGFSPEHRDWGSGFFSNTASAQFGYGGYTVLGTDFSNEGRTRWNKAMDYVKRLVDLQGQRGGKTLLSVLDYTGPYFVELYKKYYKEKKIISPAIVTNFFASPETMLPHDAHPNRHGHSILASHYINVLSRLGWILVPDEQLPPLPNELTPRTFSGPDPKTISKLRSELLGLLRSSIDFTYLSSEDSFGMLGGLFPEKLSGTDAAAPVITWGTLRSGFVLKYPSEQATQKLSLSLRIPPYPELYPFTLRISINGSEAKILEVPTPDRAGDYELEISVPGPTELEPALEVLLATKSSFSTIDDHRMKSYQLLRAALH
jgi:lysophospholipase L1-like esterase